MSNAPTLDSLPGCGERGLTLDLHLLITERHVEGHGGASKVSQGPRRRGPPQIVIPNSDSQLPIDFSRRLSASVSSSLSFSIRDFSGRSRSLTRSGHISFLVIALRSASHPRGATDSRDQRSPEPQNHLCQPNRRSYRSHNLPPLVWTAGRCTTPISTSSMRTWRYVRPAVL